MIKGNKFIHFENLDALRAIAAFTVILYHISFWFEYPTEKKYNWLKFTISFGGNGGSYGVIFFFILSGFLITYLMLEEQTLQGRINIFYFYVRRILKIWPLYYLTILIGFIIYPIISLLMGHRYTENANFLLYIIFATNFDHIYNGNPSIGILGVQWSVAVEEQFYLLWPIVFYFLSKKYFFPFIVIALIITSELFFINSVNWAISYYHFFSCLRFLAFGSLIAYLSYFKKNWIDLFLSKINKATTFSIYFTCLTLLLFEQKLYGTFLFCKYFYHILPYMFFGFIIIEQNFSNAARTSEANSIR